MRWSTSLVTIACGLGLLGCNNSSSPATGTGGGSGATGSGGAGTDGGSTTACTIGPWPAADPSMPGPFATVTEDNVGPTAGQGADGGPPVAYTLFRPSDLAQGGLCHPIVT